MRGQQVIISGFVQEAGSGETLAGVLVSSHQAGAVATTNAYGYYTLRLQSARDSVLLTYRLVGYTTLSKSTFGRQSNQVDVALNVAIQQLNEVQVKADREPERSGQQIGVPVQQIKETAALLGEKDVLKTLQLLPGVQKGNEGQTGLYVRGGGPDQNLLILDEAVVYNANHLFGFFSVFNTDALRHVDLIKGGFPARYGGRLSSVVNMQMKEGARDKLHGEGSVGLVASRVTLEGPIGKQKKASFLLAGRRSYADLVWKIIPNTNLPSLFFYDLNAKINYQFDKKNKLLLSGYLGKDNVTIEDRILNAGQSESGFRWGNLTTTLRWNNVASEKVFINTSAIVSQYNFFVFQDESSLNTPIRFYTESSSGIQDYTLKSDVDYAARNDLSFRLGVELTRHRYRPNATYLRDIRADTSIRQQVLVQAWETGLYGEMTWQPADRLFTNIGLRFSSYHVDKTTYIRPEPRLSLAYRFPKQVVLRASYSVMNQYTHLLSNSGLGLPTDLWVPATSLLGPQSSEQGTVGVNKELTAAGVSLSVEGYYKTMRNIIAYREGAAFSLIEPGATPRKAGSMDWEQNVTTGNGWSYGVELFAHRKIGRLNGWVGYTWSVTRHQFAELNGGKPFYARHDRRHDLSIVGSYHLRPRLTLSATFVYGTGNALTVPLATALISDNGFFGSETYTNAALYGERNNFRAAPYHRLDLAIRFNKPKRWGTRTWEIGAYNAYNRVNPFYYNTVTQRRTDGSGARVLTRYGLFPVIPSLSYAFKF